MPLLGFITLFGELSKVFLQGLFADRDIDLALREHEGCALVLPAMGEALILVVCLRIDVVHVAAVDKQILHRDVA